MAVINTALKLGIVVMAGAVIYKLATLPPRSFISEPSTEYDFIIVGGGSAGCVLAARLSEHFKVLLVEAGGKFGYFASVPLAAPFLQDTENDWKYRTEPQTNSSWGLVENISFWPRGKGLGGTGQMNYLLHYSGKKEDWETWEKKGLEGWNEKIMAHYMAKLRGHRYRKERFEFEPSLCPEDPAVDCKSKHCYLNASRVFQPDGKCPLTPSNRKMKTTISRRIYQEKARLVVQSEPNTNQLLSALYGAAQELKHLRLSITPGESTVFKGQRWTSYQSHLEPIINHPSLHILLKAQAQKLIITKKSRDVSQVKGIKVKTLKKEFSVKARREVIVSAGAIGSPHLLQLSGIGPKQILEDHNIEVIEDLPVGHNLHDHLNVPLFVSITQPVSLNIAKVLKLAQVFKYILMGKGAFASSGVAGIVNAPGNVGLILFGMGSTEEKLLRVISNYKMQTFNAMFPEHRNHSVEGFVLLVSCLQPKSRGVVRLRNADPDVQPCIEPNYLADPLDLACTRQGIRLAKRLVMTEPFKKLGAKLHLPALEECFEYETNINDNAYLNCLIRTIGITGYHPGGTVSMGNETLSVLDSFFKVRNVGKLRVVDSSVFPTPLLGTPHSVLMAVVERAAQLIISEANQTFVDN